MSSITYNGANRPVRFRNEETDTTVDCGYDSQGRRYFKKVTVAGTVTLHHRYIYRGYLQIACVDCTRSGHPALWFVTWDPSQPTATRPLAIQKDGTWFTYGYDLTKNICEVFGPAGYIRTSYSYAPFGAVTASGDVTQPFQWSSEHYDSELDLVYYNFRHYSPSLGRFLSRDPIQEQGGLNLYAFVKNSPIQKWDRLGRAIPRLGAGPDGGFPIYCRDRIAEFMKWFEQEKTKLEDRDENGKNWIEKLPKCPNALRKIMRLFRTTLPSGCTCYVERSTFVSPDLSEWTLTPDIVFEATQILGLLSCGMRYHPVGRYGLRTRDTSKYEGHGNQCIYDNEGNLIREIPTAGTVDWVGPGGLKIEHRNADVLQFENAVRIDSACGGNGKYVRMYYEVRPSW